MFLSPLQELPLLGRSQVYIAGLFLLVIFQIPIITTATNMNTVPAMQFMTGFRVGSPALATGGASTGDILPYHQLAYILGIRVIGTVAGPITANGPVIGGFAVQSLLRLSTVTKSPTPVLRRVPWTIMMVRDADTGILRETVQKRAWLSINPILAESKNN
ncbi:hypothetical protein GGX14DRAFT_596133 [Mycena pura]|uniref:Uncharacterized protein n=1 Tax=Mycena pura TaxID=153505 RepID=A0AAD6UWZ2_9AGAR|nr:hypothetical protein GGX14DRAFT_596133 [Mycena pura]